jgi:hypothetical protein
MRETVFALLGHAGMVVNPAPAARTPAFAEVTQVVTAMTNRFVFTRNFRGGEKIAEAGTLLAHDGETEIRTPHDDCLLVMPSLKPSRGHTAIRLAKVQSSVVSRQLSES